MVTKELYNISSRLFVGSQRIMSLLWLLPLCLFFSMPVMAQDDDDDPDMVTAEFVIQMKNDKGEEIPGTVKYAKFKNYKQALDAQNRLKVAIEQQDVALDDPVGTTIRQLKIKFKESVTGSFTQRCFYGDGVLVLAGGRFVKAFEIKKGTKKYGEVFKEKSQLLRNIDVRGEYRINASDTLFSDTWDTEEYSIFDLKVSFQPGRVKDNSRLTVHTAVINCNTDDTVAFLKPIVIEGADFHEKQDRRMAFDYYANDSMAVGYDSTKVLRSNMPFSAKVTARYKKPKGQSKTLFNAVKYVVLDDYHQPYYDEAEGAGSCLAKSPFKFLDFSVASKDIPLTSEFQEEAEENYQSVPRDLKLKFIVGSDELTKDSINQVETTKLINELRSYGNLLRVVNVRGGASPDARNQKVNSTLAAKRSNMAVNMIRKHLPGSVHINQRDPIVATWDDVLTALNKRNDVEQSVKDMVANIVANNSPEAVNVQLKQLDFYTTTIEPILESQRIMQVEYKYEREYIMDADEAVETYYREKEKLKSGERKFSPGDFYNLYSSITDSAELDTITTIAYKTITAKPRYQYIPIAPYVCNRMAMLKMRQGVPDLEILRPFINLKRNISYTERDFNTQKVLLVYNRPEIMINQAIAYFQSEELDSAAYFVNKINTPALTAELSHFINFRKYYLQGVRGEIKDPEIKKKMEAARDYVLSSDYNKAIIFTEMKTALKNNFNYVNDLLDKMDDENAKKWYLKGILWEEKAGMEPPVTLDDGFKELTDIELDMLYLQSPDSVEAYNKAKEAHDAKFKDLKDNDAPYFLAYFQHSFDLEPELKRQYFRDGNVNETRREKNPYKKKDIQKYRDKFKVLLYARNAQKASEAADEELPKSEEDNRED